MSFSAEAVHPNQHSENSGAVLQRKGCGLVGAAPPLREREQKILSVRNTGNVDWFARNFWQSTQDK